MEQNWSELIKYWSIKQDKFFRPIFKRNWFCINRFKSIKINFEIWKIGITSSGYTDFLIFWDFLSIIDSQQTLKNSLFTFYCLWNIETRFLSLWLLKMLDTQIEPSESLDSGTNEPKFTKPIISLTKISEEKSVKLFNWTSPSPHPSLRNIFSWWEKFSSKYLPPLSSSQRKIFSVGESDNFVSFDDLEISIHSL